MSYKCIIIGSKMRGWPEAACVGDDDHGQRWHCGLCSKDTGEKITRHEVYISYNFWIHVLIYFPCLFSLLRLYICAFYLSIHLIPLSPSFFSCLLSYLFPHLSSTSTQTHAYLYIHTHHNPSRSKSSNLSLYFITALLIFDPSTQVKKSSKLRLTKKAGSVMTLGPIRTWPCRYVG